VAAQRYAALAGRPVPRRTDGLVFGEDGGAAVAFMRLPGIWLAIGDPVGDPHDRVSAIWRFRDLCEQEDVDPAFWRVRPELLQVYSDIGLTPFPLTEAGEFAPESTGDTLPARYYLACRAERDLIKLLPLVPALDKTTEPVSEPA
jgi:phosphatidylglycerol lysyltransferase